MEKPMTLSKAAECVGVFPNTLRKWEKAGLIKAIRTPGGHRRYLPSEIRRVSQQQDSDSSLFGPLKHDMQAAWCGGQEYFIVDREEDHMGFETTMLNTMHEAGYDLHSVRMIETKSRFIFKRNRQRKR